VSIFGTDRTVRFQMSESGDDCVELPPSSIGQAEILDEPGVASATRISTLPLANGFNTILSRSIAAPSDGYILVIGTVEFTVWNTGSGAWLNLGVSTTSSSFPANQDMSLSITSAMAVSQYTFVTSVHGLFAVSVGTRTFYLLGRQTSGDWGANNAQLSLLFFPTAYGTVSSTLAAASAAGPEGETVALRGAVPLAGKVAVVGSVAADGSVEEHGTSPDDVAQERASCEAFNAARMERELQEMRARLARVESELENGSSGRSIAPKTP